MGTKGVLCVALIENKLLMSFCWSVLGLLDSIPLTIYPYPSMIYKIFEELSLWLYTYLSIDTYNLDVQFNDQDALLLMTLNQQLDLRYVQA